MNKGYGMWSCYSLPAPTPMEQAKNDAVSRLAAAADRHYRAKAKAKAKAKAAKRQVRIERAALEAINATLGVEA